MWREKYCAECYGSELFQCRNVFDRRKMDVNVSSECVESGSNCLFPFFKINILKMSV